jgi:hypothetical protein
MKAFDIGLACLRIGPYRTFPEYRPTAFCATVRVQIGRAWLESLIHQTTHRDESLCDVSGLTTRRGAGYLVISHRFSENWPRRYRSSIR